MIVSYALEKISEKRFDDFLAAYEKEQAELKAVLETDTEELRAYEVDSDHIVSFLKLARKYREADELTMPMIYAFVEKIIVHAPEKIDGERHMQIDIYLKFIGNFQVPQDELTAEEMAEEEKIGFEIAMGSISLKQETVEICEYYRLNPYQLTSAGSYLILTDEADQVIEVLEKAGARAVRLGVAKAQNARVITSKEEIRYLDRPAPDELARWQKDYKKCEK